MAAVISPRMALTMFSTSRWEGCGVCAEVGCTSSDLVIAKSLRRPSIYNGRVPKGQQTVKVESLDRLHCAPVLQPARERAEADGVERRDGSRMQERQVAEPVAQPIIAHRRVGIDVLLLRQPSSRHPLA